MAHESGTPSFSPRTLAARPWRAALLGALVLTGALAARGDAVQGALAQLAGLDACVSEDGTGGACTQASPLDSPFGVAVSPDGKHVYAAVYDNAAVLVLRRTRATGALTPVPGACVSEGGSGGACADGVGLLGASRVAVSPDGKHVYVVAEDSGAITAFARHKKTGALTQLPGLDACISETGSAGWCTDGRGLEDAFGLVVSPDGRHVYVVSYGSSAITAFARDRKTGALTQLPGLAGCISEDGSGGACTDGAGLFGAAAVAISPDGRHVYVGSYYGGALAAFARDKETGVLTQLSGLDACISEDGSGGACTDGVALQGAIAVAASPDGKHVYVASYDSDAVAVFARDKRTGALTQLTGPDACASEDGSGGACADATALVEPYALAVSPDGKQVYVAASDSDALSVFGRNRKTGALTQLAGLDACISEDGTGGACTDGVALQRPTSVAISANGKHVYVAAEDSNAVAALARSRR